MRSSSRAVALAVTLVLVAVPGVASAHTTDVLAQTGGTVTTLPILGASLRIEVVLDASGNLDQVNLNPATGVVATELEAHEVEFKFTDTSTQVSVEADGDELEIEVETAALADLVGPGSWSADVFSTGIVTVSYEIGVVDGLPTITLGQVAVPAGVDFTVRTEADDDEGEIRIDLFYDGFVKTLKIEVEAEGDEAELKVSLSGEDVRRLEGSLAELAGTYTWEGALCDGTPIVVTYVVSADGAVSLVDVTGTDQVAVETSDDGLEISLAGSEKEIAVELEQQDDGSWRLITEVDNDCDDDNDSSVDDDSSEADDDSSDADDDSSDAADHEAPTTNVTVADDDESEEDD